MPSLPWKYKEDSYRLKYTSFLALSEEKHSQIFKSGNCKKLCLQYLCYWCKFFRCFFSCYNWKTAFYKSLLLWWGSFQLPCCWFLWNNCLNEVCVLFFISSMHSVRQTEDLLQKCFSSIWLSCLMKPSKIPLPLLQKFEILRI